jgi:hypothetical protein
MSAAQIDEFIAAMKTLDIEFGRSRLPPNSDISDEGIIAGYHKLRYECTALDPEFRHASGHYLRERGLTRMHLRPLLPEGDLPK